MYFFCVCFFLYHYFKNILTISLQARNATLILALAIPKGVATAVVNEKKETPLIAPDKTSKALSV